jgi:origin recognition complex subunit 2
MPPRKKAAGEQSEEPQESRLLRKRSHSEIDVNPVAVLDVTPTKRRRGSGGPSPAIQNGIEDSANEDSAEETINGDDADGSATVLQNGGDSTMEEPTNATPTPRKRGRPAKQPRSGETPTPQAQRQQSDLKTPTKLATANAGEATPGRKAGADRSARRKSARALIEQVVGDGGSGDEEDGDLAREIYESSDAEDADEIEEDVRSEAASTAPENTDTPTKNTPKRRARRKAKSPTPPRDLPPHEQYFAQNKPGRPKTSDNTLAALSLLTHEEYFDILRGYEDRHKADVEYLESLHAESFLQWIFELTEGFSICLYGLGSKRSLMLKFAKEIHARGNDSGRKNKIVIVNGYTPTTTLREILTTVATAVDPTRKIPTAPPTTMVRSILSHLTTIATDLTLTLIVNSIDATPLRRPGHQSILAQLASHPQVQLVCSTDTPGFPLLWDVGLRSAFNFAFHDATTFAPLTAELDVVDDVNELLGRKSRRVNGREGVAFVLRSLPENAKNLFQLIVGEVLIAMEEEGGLTDGDVGVEYRMVYNKAVEEFICSSEMAFRTLLKEYVLTLMSRFPPLFCSKHCNSSLLPC